MDTYTDNLHMQNNPTFISLEPLQEKITQLSDQINWLIVGTETGKRKGKIIPNQQWIVNIIKLAEQNNIPLFIKNNLYKIYKELPVIQTVPIM